MTRRDCFVNVHKTRRPIPDAAEDPLAALELVSDLSEFFTAQGLFPVGTKLVSEGLRDAVNDPDWGGDLGEFVARAIFHPVEEDGVIKQVKIDLSTLVAEVDGNNEICCWKYVESE